MDQIPEIIVVGSHAPGILIHTDRVPTPGETVMGWGYEESVDGGKGSNQAIAAARLGVSTAFIGCVGNDRIGKECRDLLIKAGVDIRYLYESNSIPSGVGFIMLNNDGIPAMVTSSGANYALDEQMVLEALNKFEQPKILLTQFEIKPEVAIFAAKIAKKLGAITIINPAPSASIDLWKLAVADILVPNEIEAKLLLGLDPYSEVDGLKLAAELKRQSDCNIVIVTLGENGVAAIDNEGAWSLTPPKVNVIDTSGAGDVFCAALAVGIVRGLDIRSSTEYSIRASSLSVTKPGTIPAFPTVNEVEDFYT